MTVDDISIDVDGLPVADAGDDQVVNAGETVTLDGSGSSDPEGPLTDLSWEQMSGPEVTLASAETLQPTFTAPVEGSVLTFKLVVADGTGNFDADEVTVSVTVPDTTAPDTTFTTQPAGGVAKSLTVPFAFASSEPGTFSCALDTTVFTSCTSPTTLTVAPGPHVFRVAATDGAANPDPTPATSSFVAYDCPALDSEAAKAAKKVTKLKKKLRDTTDPDKRAKLKKKIKRAKHALRAANAAAQPCRT